jgi:hypothetical protein
MFQLGYSNEQPCGLRRGSAVVRWLELHIRIPPVSWLLSVVNVMFCQIPLRRDDNLFGAVLPGVVYLTVIAIDAWTVRRSWRNGGLLELCKKKLKYLCLGLVLVHFVGLINNIHTRFFFFLLRLCEWMPWQQLRHCFKFQDNSVHFPALLPGC